MASVPTAQEIRDFLQGYCIDSTIVSDQWITDRMSNSIIPYVERITRFSVTQEKTVTDYYSGNGDNILFLHNKNFKELVNIQFVVGGGLWVFNMNNVEIDRSEGIIKAKRNYNETYIRPYFPKGTKNIKVTYTIGYDPGDLPGQLKEAIIYLTCEQLLGFIEGMSGGGDIAVTGYSTRYGVRGRWTTIRDDLTRKAGSILRDYINLTVGNS